MFLRIYSGELHPKDDVLNTDDRPQSSASARIFRMMGDRRDSLEVAGPGEIVAVVGLKQTLHRQHAVRLARSRSPWKRSASPSR